MNDDEESTKMLARVGKRALVCGELTSTLDIGFHLMND